MDEIDYKQPPNPKFFMTVHSAWCPPKRSDLIEVQLKEPELSEPSWKDNEGKKLTYSEVGIPIKMAVKCNEDVDENASVVFRLYPEGADIKTTHAEATLQGINKNGIAETEELCWGTKDWYDPPESSNKFFFTAQTKRSQYITSDVFEIKLPEFSNLSWKKDGNNVETIFVHDKVIISCDTKNIPDYKEVLIEIVEPDIEGDDEHIFDMTSKIKESKLKIEWKVEYREKANTKSKKELDEKGYTIPEYHFYVRYYGFRSEAGPIVKLKSNYLEKAIDNNGKKIKNTEYIFITPDGKEFTGRTNSNGFIEQNDLYIGNCKIIIAR